MTTTRWQALLLSICLPTIGCVPIEDGEQASATEGTTTTGGESTTGDAASDGATTTTSGDPPTSDSTTGASTSSTTQADDTDPQDSTSTTSVATATEPTSTTGGPICGDGLIEGDEECDDGPANGENAACKDDCTSAFCGDGKIQLGKEACDLGEDDGMGQYNGDGSYGGCTELCQLGPHCGDNEIQTPDEQCEKMGPAIEDGSKCVECKWNANLVFVSSERFSGDLGGLEGADAKCQALAEAAQLPSPSSFRAWLSDSQSSPQSRFNPPVMGAYILPNGVEVASSWTDLVSGMELGSEIAVDELKMPVSKPFRAWTNTGVTGHSLAGPDCAAWTKGDDDVTGIYGRTNAKDSSWTNSAVELCFEKHHLYCVGSVG